MHKGTMKCGTPYEITDSSNVNGPSQVGGLRFGTSYTYYRIGSGEWQKTPVRSAFKTRNWLESITAGTEDDYHEWCGQYRMKPEAEELILEFATMLHEYYGEEENQALESAIDTGTRAIKEILYQSEV